MKTEDLDQSWQVVLVVTADNLHQLPQTLEDIRSKSLLNNICILASDALSVRNELSGLSLPIAFKLPVTIAYGSYWTTVTSAHEFVGNKTIFLQPGTRVPDKWDARLAAAGQRARSAIAVSPQSACHPILSVFASSDHEPELSVDEIDQWLNDYADGVEYTVPIILESCALLQGEYWRDRSCSISNDRQLLSDMRRNGAITLVTDQMYVDDFNTKYAYDISYIPKAYLDAYAHHAPLARVHHALRELSRRGEKPMLMRDCLPVLLHVGHSWGGGLGRWIEDFVAADDTHNHLVLRSIGDLSAFGQTIALYRSAELGMPIKTWTLSEPILSTKLASYEYLGIIEALVNEYNVESIIISSLVGHSLDLLRTSLPTTIVLHDYFPFCPALYATFKLPCSSCKDSELRTCMAENPRNSYFKFESYEHWLTIRREYVRLLATGSYTVIAPTQSMLDRYRKLETSLASVNVHVVPHGLDAVFAQSFMSVASPLESIDDSRRPLKILILGRLTEEKGGDLLANLISEIGEFSELYLLGTGESGVRYHNFPAIKIVESYDRTQLANLVREINPDLGMLLSTVAETFSYTLSELWAAGIPVLATRLGAFADRISESHNGWLVQPESAAVIEKLCELNANRNQLYRAKCFLAQQPIRTAIQMVADYAAVTPLAEHIPLVRYNLSRRSYCNPYRQALAIQESDALYINHQRAYREILAVFLRYTARMLEQTPRIPAWIGRPLGGSLRRLSLYLYDK